VQNSVLKLGSSFKNYYNFHLRMVGWS